MTKARPILLVDGDQAFRAVLIKQLALDGYFAASEASTAGEAEIRVLSNGEHYDALILDVCLPDGDGRNLCAKLRQRGVKVPILMLTGFNEESDIVRGLNAGANDYIAKPFRFAELLARLRAQLRTFENSEDAVLTIGPYTFRPAAKLLQDPLQKHRIRLTVKEAAILKALYRANSRLVLRPALLNEVWGYNAAVTTHTLETHIYRLRQKIEANPTSPTLLMAQTGGYRLAR